MRAVGKALLPLQSLSQFSSPSKSPGQKGPQCGTITASQSLEQVFSTPGLGRPQYDSFRETPKQTETPETSEDAKAQLEGVPWPKAQCLMAGVEPAPRLAASSTPALPFRGGQGQCGQVGTAREGKPGTERGTGLGLRKPPFCGMGQALLCGPGQADAGSITPSLPRRVRPGAGSDLSGHPT